MDHNRLCERVVISRRASNVKTSIVVITRNCWSTQTIDTAEDVNEAVTYRGMDVSGSHQWRFHHRSAIRCVILSFLIPFGSEFDYFLGYLNTFSKFEFNKCARDILWQYKSKETSHGLSEGRPLPRHTLGEGEIWRNIWVKWPIIQTSKQLTLFRVKFLMKTSPNLLVKES